MMLDQLKNDDAGKLLVRLSAGGMMLFHGIAKLMNPASLDWIGSSISNMGLPAFLSYGVYLGEIIAPLMIVIGFKARLGGLLMAGNMVVAIVLAHRGDFFTIGQHGGWAVELQMFFLFGGLIVAMLGSGRFAFKPD